MSDTQQNYENHRRLWTPWHFVAFPILAVNVIVAAVAIFRNPSLATAWHLLVAIALVLTLLTARLMSTVLQDRLISLEERLRLGSLAPEKSNDIARLDQDALIGLRFASDGEVISLVDRVVSGELTGRDAIKKEIKNWRADTHRI